jgi:Tfp pilus assembly protein PilV
MSMVELLIAMTVLAVGMIGSMVMIQLGMQSNSRNQNDTEAVALDQEILEKFATLKNYPKTGTVTITDCGTGANQHLASLVQGASPNGAGATLYTTGNAPTPGQAGEIDWTAAAPTLATAGTAGYAMQFKTCTNDVFEVRWNVMDLPNTSRLSLLTVSARQTQVANSHSGMLYSVPVTLRTLIEE